MAKKRGHPGVVAQLRNAIQASGQTLKELAESAGVDASQLSRFVRGERGLTLAAVEKVCLALRLQLSPIPSGGPSRAATRQDGPSPA